MEEELAFKYLDLWSAKRTITPFSLLDATLRLGSKGEWLRTALVSVSQLLRQKIEKCAGSPEPAKEFSGNVEGWLNLTGFTGDVRTEARRLRCKAVDVLLADGGDLGSAEEILARVDPPDLMRTGHLLEAQGQNEEAAEAFEAAGAAQDALRNWRKVGYWERAVGLVEESDEITKSDMRWLVDMQNLIDRRPAGQSNRLTEAERTRLSRLLQEVEV